ncbi:MAG TPA: hypothetical protein DCY13_24595 [Verrucomicrobiales bacterium]|nr:hypothetical protein [Verrucomicrobiales bacterium]
MLLSISHATTYFYRQPVLFGPHRMFVRAIEGHDVQIRESGLRVTPSARIRWLHDIFGNSLAIAEFSQPAQTLEIHSSLMVEQFNTNPFDFVLDDLAVSLPFSYADFEAIDVALYNTVRHPADTDAVRRWIRPFLSAKGTARTLDFFTALNKSVPLFFNYARREEPGVQAPGETLNRRSGSCRDFALLFMEAARQLGVAARFVSGYLCRPADSAASVVAEDATHAWAELYLPGAGWKGFDPTSGTLAADLHVRTAVAREPTHANPISGSFSGRGDDYLRMDVKVDARAIPAAGG